MEGRVGVYADYEPFRNVAVVIKNNDSEEICRHYLGDLTKVGAYDRVTITCDGFPHTITYDIEGNPCDKNTNVEKYVYDPDQEDWIPEDVTSCDHDLNY